MREFFQNKLGYLVIEKLNCTRQQMFDAIEEAKQAVREKSANRLIVAILTHGEEVRELTYAINNEDMRIKITHVTYDIHVRAVFSLPLFVNARLPFCRYKLLTARKMNDEYVFARRKESIA